MIRTTSSISAVALLAGCVSLAPHYQRPEAPVAQQWPQGESYAAQPAETKPLPAWRDFYADPKLRALIERALEENRDLRVAALNIERARQLYRVQRSQTLPTIAGEVQGNIQE